MTELPLVTVLVPARNEEESIGGCLDAIMAQDYPLDRLEVIVIDGASTDRTAELAEKMMQIAPLARGLVVANPQGVTPRSLNLGLANARGAVVCRVDARSVIPPSYVRSCVDSLQRRPDVVVVGGSQLAVPRSDAPDALGIARALNNRWGMGLSKYRRDAGSGRADTVYLGAFRTDDLTNVGGWDERFETNQDFELNRRLAQRGTVWFDSSLTVGYVPRRSVRELFHQYHRFGRWKARYWRTTGDRPRPRQVALLAAPIVGPLAGLALWRHLRPRGRRVLVAATLAGVATFEQAGSEGPAGPARAHATSLVASAAVGLGWFTGVVREMTDRSAAVAAPSSTSPAVVYVASRWGEPSQTFVRREASALRDLGVGLHAATLKRPVACEPQADVVWLSPLETVLGVARGVLGHPLLVARVFAAVLARSAPRNMARQAGAAAIGVAWVGSRRLPPGHLHAHFGWVAATAAWAAATVDRRSFSVSLHAFEIYDLRYVDGFTGVPLREALAVFTESHRDRKVVDERWNVSATVTRLGVPSSWLADPAADRDRLLVVAVGRLVEKKGHGLLLSALARTQAPWRCVIVGDGPLREALEAQIAQLGLGDRVTLTGALPEAEVATWLRRASVSCLASVETASGDRDGTPMALIEAMASGAAVVATDTGSIAELLADAGVVVPAGDVDALADGLDQLADPDHRLQVAQRAVVRVAEEWTADRTARVVAERLGLAIP